MSPADIERIEELARDWRYSDEFIGIVVRSKVHRTFDDLHEARKLLDRDSKPGTCHTHRIYDCWQCRPRVSTAARN